MFRFIGNRLRSVLAILISAGSLDSYAGGDDEIQVYTDQINGKGNYGWELHQNWVPTGNNVPEYTGDSPAQGQIRHTSEFSYGLADNWEIGAYLPVLLRNGNVSLEGGKGRIKFLDHLNDRTFYGLNVEYGYDSARSAQNHWNTELRPIIGYRDDNWLVGFNPVVGVSTSGKGAWQPTFEPQIKVAHSVGNGYMLGVEHYADLGAFSRIDPWQQQTQTTYLTLDTIQFKTNFNFGVGHGWTMGSNDLTVKFIVGLPINGWAEKLVGL
jgi:hypothetical protein